MVVIEIKDFDEKKDLENAEVWMCMRDIYKKYFTIELLHCDCKSDEEGRCKILLTSWIQDISIPHTELNGYNDSVKVSFIVSKDEYKDTTLTGTINYNLGEYIERGNLKDLTSYSETTFYSSSTIPINNFTLFLKKKE